MIITKVEKKYDPWCYVYTGQVELNGCVLNGEKINWILNGVIKSETKKNFRNL